MDEHLIHRLDEFLPHLARLQPHLIALLPEEERPPAGMPLSEWVLSLPQPRMVEICSAWVLESLQHLRLTSPLTNVLLRGCLLLTGEFDVSDAGALATGDALRPGDPRREEVRQALSRAVRLGMLIYRPAEERYCVPFPVRLSFEGVDFLEPLERDTLRLRAVRYFGALAEELTEEPELATPKYWRFSNLLAAYEIAAAMMEELLGLEEEEWVEVPHKVNAVPRELALPLLQFGRFLGRALVHRQSASGARLLAASAASAHTLDDLEWETEALSLLGQFYLRRGRFPDAIRVYRRWERLRRTAGDQIGVVLALSATAIAFREHGEREAALAEFVEAARIARRENLLDHYIDTTNCAAQILIQEARHRDAIDLLRNAVEDAGKRMIRMPAFAELLVHLGTALRQDHQPDASRSRLLEALVLAQTFPHRPAEARCCLQLGFLAQDREHWTEANRWLRRSMDVFLEISDRTGAARAAVALSRPVLRLEGDTQADQLLARAYGFAQAARDKELMGEVWEERGKIALAQGEETRALACFHNQIEILRHTDSAGPLMEAHMILAELYLAQEALVAGGAEALRAQGIARSRLTHEPEELKDLLTRLQTKLTPEQLEFLVAEVTEELEAGKLIGVGDEED